MSIVRCPTEPRPLAKIDDSPAESWHRPTPTPTATATADHLDHDVENARDGLHPTARSDGNKVMPGGTSTDDSPASGATGTSTSITATGTTGTTETTGTTGTTDGAATDHESPAANAA